MEEVVKMLKGMEEKRQEMEEKRQQERIEDKEELKSIGREIKEGVRREIEEGIRMEVENATKPMKEYQEKMVKDQAHLLKTVDELTKKVDKIEKEALNERDYPRLEKPCEGGGDMTKKTVTNKGGDTEHLTKDQKAVRGFFKMSNRTLGLSPISKEFIDTEVTKKKEESGETEDVIKAVVMKDAVKEFMILEMKVKEEHFDKLNMIRIFTPQKTDWQTLYVELESEDQVDWVLSHTRWIPEVGRDQVQTKVVKYVPKQLYKRWNALQAIAFTIRKESNWTIKTKVGHGRDDFFLQTRPKGEQTWSKDQKLPEDLPKVDLEFLSREERSPASAPGRERYRRTEKRKERPSSSGSSSSPSSPPQKQLNTKSAGPGEVESGLLSRPDISRVVEINHPPGSPGHGIRNPALFNHLSAQFVSSRKK